MELHLTPYHYLELDIKPLVMTNVLQDQNIQDILFKQWTLVILNFICEGARYTSMVRAFAHGAMGRRIDPSWSGPIELFLVPASAPRLV